MFIILNKEKITAYVVSILTVIMLFGISNISFIGNQTVETAANTEKLLPIYSVNTEEKKIAFTMNCAWSGDDIDDI